MTKAQSYLLYSLCTDPSIAFIYYIYVCVCYRLSSFFFPLSPELQTSLIFYISAYHLFTLLWRLQCSPPVSLSPQVPVALTDSLQSVANRTRVSLAPTHKQHAAHPPHQPTSIPMIVNTQCRGRMFSLVSVLGLKSFFCICWILCLTIPGVRLVDTQQVVEAKGRVLAKLLALNHGRKTNRQTTSVSTLSLNEVCWRRSWGMPSE